MKALDIPSGKLPAGSDKTAQLKAFQARGLFLIDVSYIPVNKLSGAEKKRITNSQASRLVSDVKGLQPEKIVIIKTSIFFSVKAALEGAGFGDNLQNKMPIPFPSNGWQAIYRQMIKDIVNPTFES